MYSYPYQRPQLTADILVSWRNKILVVVRKNQPFQGFYALPGGFCDMHERLVHAAVRELKEETSIVVDEHELEFIGLYDEIKRDPRDRTVSGLFFASFKDKPRAVAADDAASVEWIDIYDVLDGKIKLAFDHGEMVEHVYNLKFSDS